MASDGSATHVIDTRRDVARPLFLAGAFALPAVGGCVNAMALLGFTHGAVSHMTGLVSIGVIDASIGERFGALHAGAVVLAFAAGAVLSGALVGGAGFRLARRYGVALMLEGLLLASAVPLLDQHVLSGELLCAMACGLQNALVANYSGAIIRSTHVTGVITDLGLILGNVLAGRWVFARHAVPLLTILGGFVLGLAVGARLYQAYGFRALLAPAGFVLLVGLAYFVLRRRLLVRARPALGDPGDTA